MVNTKHWTEYLWIWAVVYFVLGYFNILFAWLGLLDFTIPLVLSSTGKGKYFCNNLCARGKLLRLTGTLVKGKRRVSKTAPRFISGFPFRLAFLTFFLAMFVSMLYKTYLVFKGKKELKAVLKLFWTFTLPWKQSFIETGLPHWVYQFGYGFYSTMLTSTIIALILMLIWRPRTWCTFCPMGMMTQCISKVRAKSV